MAEASVGDVMHRSVLGGPLGRVLSEHRDEVLALATRHGLTNVRVFGSMARGDDGSDSEVDLVPARSLKPRLRPEVEAKAVPL